MDESKRTPLAVVLAAFLHLGIVLVLYLAIVPCTTYERWFEVLHLPAGLNPIACHPPVELPGEPIQAVFIGPTGSPPPKPTKVKKPVPDTVPPPPAVPPPTPQVQAPVVKTLPPPPVEPDVVDQEKVVADALQKAEDAKHEQEEKQRERQSELDALAAKKKEEQKKKLDALFAKLDKASAATKQADSKKRQAEQQLADAKDAADDGEADLPKAAQRQTGNNGPEAKLIALYQAAIQNAVTPNWQRPDNMPSVPCVVHIAQIPGGDVISAKVDSSCPYDAAGRRSIENAVLRTNTLPYKGFEKVFAPRLTMTFRPQ